MPLVLLFYGWGGGVLIVVFSRAEIVGKAAAAWEGGGSFFGMNSPCWPQETNHSHITSSFHDGLKGTHVMKSPTTKCIY